MVDPSVDENREKALRAIFTSYARSSQGQASTFDEIKQQLQSIDLKQFLAFCKEFEIPLSSKNELAVYKKVVDGTHSSVIQFDEFKAALKYLFAEV